MLHEQYLMLNEKLAVNGPAGIATEVSLEQVAETLFCTPRNAKLVLRKLEEEGWIAWQAGRGRGNRSRLTFLAGKETLLFDWARQWAEKGDYKQAFELLRNYGSGTSAKERFVEWLNGHFGYRKEEWEGEAARDTLRLPVYRPILTLDPAEVIYSFASHMIQQLFDRLVNYDYSSGTFIPGIAHHWECGEDATVWTFHLRKGILFHDGKELTADDVKFSMERLRQGKRNSWILRSLERIEVVSSRIVRFRLSRPNRLFLRYLCSTSMSILPRDLGGQEEERFWKRPVGTGPFIVEEWTEDRFVMHANPHYYQGRPHLDTVELIIMPREASEGAMEWRQLLCDPERRELKPENGWEKIESAHCCTSLLTWNMKKDGPHRSTMFRRAVDLLIDRDRMIRELGEYRLYPARGFFLDAQAPFRKHRHDVELAKSMLREAGYDGTPITLGTYATHTRDGEWIRDRCEEAGIPVIFREEHMETILDPAVMSGMDCIVHALVLPGEEVCLIENYEQDSSFVKELLDPRLSGWIREQIDRALETEQPLERQGLLCNIEDRLREEAHILFLLHTKFYTYSHPSYKGVKINPLGWMDFKEIWME